MSCFGSFQNMCKRIVCPTRHSGVNEHHIIYRKFRNRLPPYEIFNVSNQKGKLLSVMSIIYDASNLPTIIYLHGNGGHKMEALQLISPYINLVSFDFGACGKSQGDYLTYGQKEALDVSAVVEAIKKKYGIRKVVIWGRSMGASIGIMYCSLFPKQVSCLILDTPFRWVKEVVRNIAQHGNSVPSFMVSLGLSMVERKLIEMLNQNIFLTDFKMYLNLLEIPAVFIYSTTDIVVKQQNVKQLYEIYKGYKQLRMIEAMHHEDRPKEMIQDVILFIRKMERPKSMRYSFMSGGNNNQKKGIKMSMRGQIM